MTAPAVPTASETAPSATELEQDLGQMFGDYSSSGESPEPDASAAGTTPAEPAPGTEPEPNATEPEGGADAPETPGDGTTPAAAPEAIEDDPFKDTTPAQYVVNGQTIPVEDIRVFKEGGAVIRPESLPNVLAKLAERDTLSERVRTRDAEYTTLSKVSEWTDQSSGKTYTGPEAAIEMRIGNAALFAENQLLLSHLTDPAKLRDLLTTEPVFDAQGRAVLDANGQPAERVILNPQAIDALKRENALTAREAANAIRDHYKTVVAQASKPEAAPIDFASVTPGLIQAIAKESTLDASVLTPADKQMLAKQLPFHIKDGLASVEWQELVKDRIALRAEQKTASLKLVSSTTDAVKKGQAAMAAAARGVRPTPKAPAAPPRPVSPHQERMQNEGDAFDAMERASAAAIRRNA